MASVLWQLFWTDVQWNCNYVKYLYSWSLGLMPTDVFSFMMLCNWSWNSIGLSVWLWCFLSSLLCFTILPHITKLHQLPNQTALLFIHVCSVSEITGIVMSMKEQLSYQWVKQDWPINWPSKMSCISYSNLFQSWKTSLFDLFYPIVFKVKSHSQYLYNWMWFSQYTLPATMQLCTAALQCE